MPEKSILVSVSFRPVIKPVIKSPAPSEPIASQAEFWRFSGRSAREVIVSAKNHSFRRFSLCFQSAALGLARLT
jgi:hypothetical protein